MIIFMSKQSKEHYTLTWKYEFVLVAGTISHSFAALNCKILFLPLKRKIHIFVPPWNILYLLTRAIISWDCLVLYKM